MRDLGGRPLLAAEDERGLAVRAKGGDAGARDELVCRNVKLVLEVAGRAQARHRKARLEDLVSAGIEGLIEAVDRFDPSRGFRLSTYAYYWIDRYVTVAAQADQLVRVPAKVLAAAMHCKMGTVPPSGALDRKYVAFAARAMALSAVGFSGAHPEEDEIQHLASRDGEARSSADSRADRDLSVAMLGSAINCLKPSEAFVIRLRYGLDGGPPMTLVEAGKRLGVSKQRASQLEHAALARLGVILQESTKGVA
jgi:RNA polymerase primary sigma factor